MDEKTPWISVAGKSESELQRTLTASVNHWSAAGAMPPNEVERIAKLSTAISQGSFSVSPERLELLRGLCQIYSAGIRAEKITSHRKVLGPVIVFVKRSLFRVVSALLGPTFQFQRDFNAGVIRLLADLSNEQKVQRD
ncbi:MAG: hypothetical protein ACK5Y6_09655 [Pseudomonadota bacterium]|jgi:hypothetical protein